MLSLDDIRHLDAAVAWLERGDYVSCFHELERIDYDNRDHARVCALRWSLYNQTRQHSCAADVALRIQARFPHEVAGYVWRAVSLNKLGCTQEAYDELVVVAQKFDGAGIVPYVLSVLATELRQYELAQTWLMRAFATPDGQELKLQSLEEKSLDSFWRKIVQVG